MAWNVEGTDEFQAWFQGLSAAERISVVAKIDLLVEEEGLISDAKNLDTDKERNNE